MPKVKTSRAAAKRFKTTGTGKLVRNKAYKSHILTKKDVYKRQSLPQMRESSTVRKKPSPTTSPLSLETMSDARGLHSTTSGGNSFTSINMSEFPTYSRSTPQPPAPPRWQESEPKPERSSRENVQTSSSPQRIRSKTSVLCARSKWLSRREEKSTIRR